MQIVREEIYYRIEFVNLARDSSAPIVPPPSPEKIVAIPVECFSKDAQSHHRTPNTQHGRLQNLLPHMLHCLMELQVRMTYVLFLCRLHSFTVVIAYVHRTHTTALLTLI